MMKMLLPATAVTVAIAATAGYRLHRSPDLEVESPRIDVGESAAGTDRTAHVTIRNRSEQALRILGASTSCSCVVAEELPFTIDAGARHDLDVAVHFRGDPDQAFRHSVVFYSDSERSPQIQVELSGRVAGVASSIDSPEHGSPR